MKKYYCDPAPFLYDDPTKWKFVISFIRAYGETIEVVQQVTSTSDMYSRANIQRMLTTDFSHFECAKPIDKTVSLSPFIVKDEFASVCFRYNMSRGVVDELEAEWLEVLKKEMTMLPFIIFSDDIPIFWVNGTGAFFLLGDGEKDACVKSGCELEEWNIPLNESLYGMVSGKKIKIKT